MASTLSPYLDGSLTLYREVPLNWTAAEAHCVTLGGHLASAHSMAENAILASLCGDEECWIGFNDIDVEGTWRWIDGSIANFSSFPGGVAPWNPGEPNGLANERTDGAYIYPCVAQPLLAPTHTRASPSHSLHPIARATDTAAWHALPLTPPTAHAGLPILG